jgi:hypothetical protein
VSTAARAQRCAVCDGVQPITAEECEICGARLDGSLAVAAEEPDRRRFERTPPRAKIVRKPDIELPRPTSVTTSAISRSPAASHATHGAGTKDASTTAKRRTSWSFQAHLGGTLASAVCVAIALVSAGASLTFQIPNASSKSVVLATFENLWPWMLATVVAGWLITVVGDYFASARARVARVPRRFVGRYAALPCGVFALGTVHASELSGDSYVPPSTWVWLLLAALLAYGVVAVWHVTSSTTPGGKLVLSKIASRALLFFLSAGVLAGGWFAPTVYGGPPLEQIGIDSHTLGLSVPIGHCKRVPVATDPRLVIRDTVRASVICSEGTMIARFLWFRSRGMMHVYSSARAGGRAFSGDRCSSGAPYLSSWHEGNSSHSLGQLMCIPMGHENLIAWENDDANVYGVVRARESMGKLYRWWERQHLGPPLGL